MDSTVLVKTAIGSLHARFQAHPSHENPQSVSAAPPLRAILKCLGIRYGEVPYRWAAPRLAQTPWPGTQDFTQFGPECPQIQEPLFNVAGLPVFGPSSATSVSISAQIQDEFGCLNLNVYTPVELGPDGTIQNKSALPVMVWVHGGAFRAGSGGVDLYDATPVVERSLDIGHPVILVTLNYRLGVLGFIHSAQLQADAAKQEDIPPHFRSTGNLALLDTYMAFKWIKKHISHFGGNPQNITGFGESAGSSILNYISLIEGLHVKIQRMLYSSSTIFSVQLLREAEAQKWFDEICEKNNVPHEASDSVSQLRQIDVDTLVCSSHFACTSFRPILDNITIADDPRNVILDGSRWDDSLEAIVFGHCENEAWLKLAYRSGLPPPLPANIIGRIPPDESLRSKAMQLYGAQMDPFYSWYQSPEPMELKPGALSWMALDGHSRYYVPGRLLSKSFLMLTSPPAARQRVVYKYIFSWVSKNWPKNWPATHVADLLPMFLHKSLSADDIVIAQTFVDQIIRFAEGKQDEMAWQIYDPESWLLNVLRQDGGWEVLTEGSGEFGLTDESVKLWQEVFHRCLTEDGWEGNIR